MNKAVKQGIAVVVALAILVGAVWGGLTLYRNAQKKPVNVYAVSDFAMTDYWGDTAETEGVVSTDKLQKVSLSGTQTVEQILVQEGQTVHVGDPLVRYDTTLTTLDVTRAEIELNRQKLQLDNAKKELAQIKQLKPNTSTLITPPEVVYEPVETPRLLKLGEEGEPSYYLWDEANDLSAYLEQWLGDASEATVVLVVRENNALNARVVASFGLELARQQESDQAVIARLFTPELPQELLEYEEQQEPYYQEEGSAYTAAELAQMRANLEKEIRDLEISSQLAAVELKRLQHEVADGVIYSELDGVVKTVADPETAAQSNKPLVEVSADGGGYYITGAVSELEMDALQVGQSVSVYSWMSGASCEGTVTEISTSPVEGDVYSYTDGNRNVSWYAFRVFVEAGADLREGDYVQMSYEKAEESGSLYLENMFIRTENGKSYVYVQGADGTLEQRFIQTGRGLWSSYTQVRSGLSAEEYIAFPYGPDVAAGAKTQQATIDEFYNY